MISEWQIFFTVIIGATGAFLGLLFVSISINLAKITAVANLARSAIQPLYLLFTILVTSIYFLIPAQTIFVVGIEVLITSFIFAMTIFRNDIWVYKNISENSKRKMFLVNIIFNLLPVSCIITAGIFMVLEKKNGIYLMIPAIIFSLIMAFKSSWDFLVEINLHSTERWENKHEKESK